jgi:hypothetical protein
MSSSSLPTASSNGRPVFSDGVFLALLALALGVVVWVGHLAYVEGHKTEQTKRLGEAWLQWLQQAGTDREREDFLPRACARSGDRQWGACLNGLTDEEGPLKNQVNAFSGQPFAVVAKCDFADRSTVGALVIEKLSPTPPGSAVPFVVSPLSVSDPIDGVLALRVAVCDKGAGPIKIGEAEF